MAPAAATRSGAPRGGGLPFLSFPGAGSSPLRARPPPPPAEPGGSRWCPRWPQRAREASCPLCARATPLLHSWAGGRREGGIGGAWASPKPRSSRAVATRPRFRPWSVEKKKERKKGPPGPGSTRASQQPPRSKTRPRASWGDQMVSVRRLPGPPEAGDATSMADVPRRAAPCPPPRPPAGRPLGPGPRAPRGGRWPQQLAGRGGGLAPPPGGATAGPRRGVRPAASRSARPGPRGPRGRRPGPSRSARPGAAWEETGGGRGGGVGGGRGRRKGGQA